MSGKPRAVGGAKKIRASAPQPADRAYRVRHYDLELDYRVATNRLSAQATLTVETQRATDRLHFDLIGLTVTRVTVDRRRIRWTAGAQGLVVRLDTPVAVGHPIPVVIHYEGRPRPRHGPFGEVGWEELSDGVLVAGQPDGAPTWFPCQDDPADKATYRIAVTTQPQYRVVANGVLVERRTRANGVRWVYEQAEPMATYLAAVYIGRYVPIELVSASVPQVVLAPLHLRRRCLADFARQPAMVDAFTRWFGPYPFSSYTVVVTDDPLEIPLEAQTLATFGANHIDGRGTIERLVAHELAHQWFGNSLTPTEWRHVWLNEGFACYAEWLWSEESGGSSADACARRWWLRLVAQPQDLAVSDPGPTRLFDERVYKRGALCLHALRLTMGDRAFFALLRDWTDRHRHGGVTTVDFEHLAAHHAPVGVRELLATWLHEGPIPSLPPVPAQRPKSASAASMRISGRVVQMTVTDEA